MNSLSMATAPSEWVTILCIEYWNFPVYSEFDCKYIYYCAQKVFSVFVYVMEYWIISRLEYATFSDVMLLSGMVVDA